MTFIDWQKFLCTLSFTTVFSHFISPKGHLLYFNLQKELELD